MPILGGGSSVRAGTVQAWPASSAPTGWLKCNGAAISRTLYAALFNVIGTTYGAGDGSTTFNVPDFRGEFLRGLDDGKGVDPGRVLGSSQTDEFASHTHDITPYSNVGGSTYRPTTSGFSVVTTVNATAFNAVNSRGGIETRPRNQAALMIIKF